MSEYDVRREARACTPVDADERHIAAVKLALLRAREDMRQRCEDGCRRIGQSNQKRANLYEASGAFICTKAIAALKEP